MPDLILLSEAYLLTPLSFILALSGLGCCIICVYLFRFKRSPGIRHLALMEGANAIWCFCYCLEYSAENLQLRLFWSGLSYFGIIFTSLFFYFFSLRFFREEPVSSRLKTTLIIFSFFPIAGALTNNYHHLHWITATINPQNHTTIYQYGPFFWLTFVYTYGLLISGMVVILRLLHHKPKPLVSSVWMIILAFLVPVTGNILYVFKLNPVPGFDWTPVCFLISGILLTYINVRFNTFDLLPLAREKLVEGWEDGILIIDQRLRIADFNQAFLNLTGKTREDLEGKDLFDAFTGQNWFINNITGTTASLQKEVELDLNDGKRYMEIRSTPLTDPNAVLWGTLFIVRDITSGKRNEYALMKANQELKKEISEKEKLINDLNAFAHTIAHDLRDSIGSIVSLSNLIRSEIGEKNFQTIPELNDMVYHSANKTLLIIKELLILSTVRQENIYKQDIDMAKVITECEIRLQEVIKATQATIVKPEAWPKVKTVPAWIEEVWVNYLGNALKYGGTPPVIELGAEQLPQKREIKFWIRDNGNGIPLKDQDKLFSQFTRLETTRAQGNGLGLSIVKRIIDKLGGRVGVFSNAIPGQGSTFYFILPQD